MDRNIVTQAIVLHSRRDGTNNVNLTLLSLDLGIITVRAFGAKTSKKAPKAFRFQEGQFFLYFNPTNKQYVLKDVNLIATHDLLSTEFSKICIASLLSEIILKTYSDNLAFTYSLFTKSLDLLEDNSINEDLIVIQFILKLIKDHGFYEDFEYCPNCEKKYEEDEILYFSNSLTVPSCKNCSNSSNMILPPKARKYLIITQNLDLEEAIAVLLYKTTAQRIKSYMIRWIIKIIGHPLKSLNVYN
ncbi:MAG: DNA repair protein RecO [Sphaerochaetaceae bacterium]|nr:DNA repair protein RecO [Sphaerochaetaceae bacterium]